MSSSVTTDQRFTTGNPCPICGGGHDLPRGEGQRCFGFLSDDGSWAHCSREEYAGNLPLNTNSETYAHLLSGQCSCGQEHHGPAGGCEGSGSDNGEFSYEPTGDADDSQPGQEPDPSANGEAASGGSETYWYNDENGQPLHYTWRKPGPAKEFSQGRYDPATGQAVPGLDGVPLVLYRLPQVLAAAAAGQTVYVVEGEKDVHEIEAAAGVATCNPMGAGKWRPEFSEVLCGADVVVVQDKDGPEQNFQGQKHGAEVFWSLAGKAGSVRLVEAAAGKDAADHLAAGHRLDQFVDVFPADVLPAEPLGDIELTPFGWGIKGWWPHPSPGMAAGMEKTLKSYLASFEAIAIASGRPLFGELDVVVSGPVLFFTGELNAAALKRRLLHLARGMGLPNDEFEALPIYVIDKVKPAITPEFQNTLRYWLAVVKPVKVFVDPLYCYFGADVDAGNLHAAGPVLAAIGAPCVEAGSSLQIVNHFRKSAESSSNLSLTDITQAGGREWCDSWVLVRHREDPVLTTNFFRLHLSVGSRHGFGRDYALDLYLGRVDDDTLEFVETPRWSLQTDYDPARECEQRQEARREQLGKSIKQWFATTEFTRRQYQEKRAEQLGNEAGTDRMKKRAERELTDLVGEDYLDREEQGTGKPHLYRLLEPREELADAGS